ncbi:hypothetical protein JCM21900_001361 [Sporobolomyces salmonicolor]
MVKAKSSASSATRKKHAAKQAKKNHQRGSDDDDAPPPPRPAQRGQKKQKKDRFAPKIKSYVPPPPPPKGAPDPVDVYLVQQGKQVDPELVVVLRRLAKKDEATVGKGLEGFEGWVGEVLRREKDGEGEEWERELQRDEVVECMAVWAHHFPRLALHPSRRLRLAVHSLHSLLTLSSPSSPSSSLLLQATRAALLSPLWTDQPSYVGAWSVAAFDHDRAVRREARRSWDAVVLPLSSDEGKEQMEGISLIEQAEPIVGFAFSLILGPGTSSSSDTPPTSDGASAPEDPAFLRTSALHALSYLLSILPWPLPLEESAIETLLSEEMWELVVVRGQERTGEREQPPMVRRGLYELLGTIAGRKEDLLVREGGQEEEGQEEEEEEEAKDQRLRVVSRLVLENCWVEEEGWPGIISWLRRYPQAWTLADAALAAPGDASDDEVSHGDGAEQPPIDFIPSPTLSLLLTHLSLACTSHPLALYPTILLLLSTLPRSSLPVSGPLAGPALNTLFEHFWAAHSARALAVGGRPATDAWVAALLECLAFEVSKVEDEAVAQDLASEWTGRMLRAFLGVGEDGREAKGRLAGRRVAGEVEKCLGRFAGKSVYEGVWRKVEEATWGVFGAEAGEKSLPALGLTLQAFVGSASDMVRQKGRDLAKEAVKRAVTAVQQLGEGEGASQGREELLMFLGDAKELVKDDAEVEQLLDDLAVQQLPAYLSTSPAALSVLTSHLSSTSRSSRSSIWYSLFASPPSPSVLLKLIAALAETGLAGELPSANLDEEVRQIAQRVLGDEPKGTEDELEVLRRVMLQPQPFIDASLPAGLLDLAASSLVRLSLDALSSSSSVSSASLAGLTAPTALLANYAQLPENAQRIVALDDAPTMLFKVGYLLPNCRIEQQGVEVPGEAIAAAQQAWEVVVRVGGDAVAQKAMASLREKLVDATVRPSAIEEVLAASMLLSTASPSTTVSLADIIPSPAAFDVLYASLKLASPSPSLSIVEPLVPSHSDDSAFPAPSLVDCTSLTPYPRALLALLEITARDHALARRSLWALPHLLLLASCARDELSTSSVSTGMFGSSVPLEVLERLVSAAEGAASYILSSACNSLPEGWHASAVAHLRAKEQPKTEDKLLEVLAGLCAQARAEGARARYARRAVRTVLSAALRYTEGGAQDAERWLAFAQNLTSAPDLACAILYAIKPILLETPRFERYQNELAATLAGVPSSSLLGKGLPLLGQLLASAPPLDAPIIFLPQQRTMFLIQAIQRWVASDEGLPEEVGAGVVELLGHLVAIVQELSGSHWDLVFDLIESNLESAEWDEPSTIPAVYHSCRLLAQMKELSSANSDLRAVAKERVDTSLELVLTLFVSRPNSTERNAPRALLVSTMAQLIRDLPPKLLTMSRSFTQLLRLLQDPSLAVQLSSYDLLRRVIGKHVGDLVVEVELDQEGETRVELPGELVRLLERKVQGAEEAEASSYLLAWLTTFAFFEHASPRLRSAYIDQLRNADLVAGSLLPALFRLLNLSDRTRPIDLSPWSIDDFHLELVDSLDLTTLSIFAAHVYYRSLQAVPSLIRAYWASLQNLQLSRTIQTFTARHFSPLLISSELWSVRDPSSDVGKQLRDNDDFTVKVAAGANEVKCVFVVDEESMEIGVKVPNEFPLVAVEVKDVRKIGVSDKQWRAWLLAVQQVITSQSSAIADALLLFKRNVTLHFEGVESCAICYSTVSAVDRSLPSKACKTCSNKFHAGCLYKWFQTSHGSTCPLCRQIM